MKSDHKKKPTMHHPDYVDKHYRNYLSYLDYNNKKSSPVDFSSPDSSAATSEAGVGKLGLQTQLAMRPKKKKKNEKSAIIIILEGSLSTTTMALLPP